MTKKIRKSIIFVSSITLCFTMILIIGSLYSYFTKLQQKNSKEDLNLLAVGVSQTGINYLENLYGGRYRITWVDSDGTVLFDTKADITLMENHSNREEILNALKYGEGESKRVSATLSEETIYTAKKLEDGTIIRISFTQLTILSLLYNMLPFIAVIAVISLILAIILASKTAQKTLLPLNFIDLNNPLDNYVYDEISPFLQKIDKQNKKITKQIKALENQKQEIEFITENVADGILILNNKGEILSCNKVAKRLLSCEENGFYLNYYRNIEFEKLIENALRGKNGKIKIDIENEIYYFSASAIKLIENEFSVFLFIHNITDEENAEEMRKQFSANVSHELKTPLTSIMGASELISNGLVKSEDIKKFADNIYKESQRLYELVQDIIRLSKLDEQKKFEFEVTDISLMTKDVISHLSKKAKEKNIDIIQNIIQAKINTVPTIIYEMLYNLVDNAIAYNKQNGKVLIDIDVSEERSVWTIKDSGIGIAKEDLSRVFERFYRVDKSHSKESGGTGLGLSIVKNGAKLHNAQIEIESEIDVGTTISLIFEKKQI